MNTINGTPSDDILIGTSGDDHILGGDGDDILFGRGGNDVVDGGGGKVFPFGTDAARGEPWHSRGIAPPV